LFWFYLNSHHDWKSMNSLCSNSTDFLPSWFRIKSRTKTSGQENSRNHAICHLDRSGEISPNV
jgi:hypothetical protein